MRGPVDRRHPDSVEMPSPQRWHKRPPLCRAGPAPIPNPSLLAGDTMHKAPKTINRRKDDYESIGPVPSADRAPSKRPAGACVRPRAPRGQAPPPTPCPPAAGQKQVQSVPAPGCPVRLSCPSVLALAQKPAGRTHSFTAHPKRGRSAIHLAQREGQYQSAQPTCAGIVAFPYIGPAMLRTIRLRPICRLANFCPAGSMKGRVGACCPHAFRNLQANRKPGKPTGRQTARQAARRAALTAQGARGAGRITEKDKGGSDEPGHKSVALSRARTRTALRSARHLRRNCRQLRLWREAGFIQGGAAGTPVGELTWGSHMGICFPGSEGRFLRPIRDHEEREKMPFRPRKRGRDHSAKVTVSRKPTPGGRGP